MKVTNEEIIMPPLSQTKVEDRKEKLLGQLGESKQIIPEEDEEEELAPLAEDQDVSDFHKIMNNQPLLNEIDKAYINKLLNKIDISGWSINNVPLTSKANMQRLELY